MQTRFSERIQERAIEALEWIDYRPDPHPAVYLSVPISVGLASAFVPPSLLPVFFGLCLMTAAVAVGLFLIGLGGRITFEALSDLVLRRAGSR